MVAVYSFGLCRKKIWNNKNLCLKNEWRLGVGVKGWVLQNFWISQLSGLRIDEFYDNRPK